MLDIEYKGGNTVVLSSRQATLIVDPKLSIVGLKDLKKPDSIEVATEERFAVNSDESRVVITTPGDYGVADFDIHGIAAQRHLDASDSELLSTMYRIETGDIRVGVIGNIYESLNDEQIEELGVLDVLIVPIGGNGYTLDAVGAVKLIGKIGPKIIIPVHYADPGLKYEVPQNELEEFIKELGAPSETVAKLKLKAASITSEDQLKIVVIERS